MSSGRQIDTLAGPRPDDLTGADEAVRVGQAQERARRMAGLATFELRAGRRRKAADLLEQAFAAFPDHRTAARLASLQFKRGSIGQALAYVEKALALASDDTETLRKAAEIHAAAGDAQAAQRIVEDLAHLGENGDAVAELRDAIAMQSLWLSARELPEAIPEITAHVRLRDRLFDADQVAQVRTVLLASALKRAEVTAEGGRATRVDEETRLAHICNLPLSGAEEVYRRVYSAVKAAAAAENRALIAPDGALRIILYKGDEGGKFEWHRDSGPGRYRRRHLSCSVLISPAADFSGGELEFSDGATTFAPPLDVGDIVVFPSDLLHRVTPLTAGTRISLVGWFLGPLD